MSALSRIPYSSIREERSVAVVSGDVFSRIPREDLEAQVRFLRGEVDRLRSERNTVGISFRRVPETGEQIQALYDEKFPYLEYVRESSYTLRDRHADEKSDSKELSAPTDGNTTLIESDNLAALASLQLTHQGKVDVIYIDPPYNTGNKGFVYNDARTSRISDVVNDDGSSVDIESYGRTLDGDLRGVGRDNPERHSLWLSFMEKRLWLAKHLLADTGVIFVSIDDNEYARLKLLMDTVFGEDNFVGSFVWQKTTSRRNDAKYLSNSHEYVLTYMKDAWDRRLLPRSEDQLKRYRYDDNDGRGRYALDTLSVARATPSSIYPIVNPDTGEEHYPPKGRAWGVSPEGYQRLFDDGRTSFGVSGTSAPKRKKYLTEVRDGVTPKTLLLSSEVGDTAQGTKEVKSILGGGVFNYPKPASLIKHLVQMNKKDALVLDFFAGSGTTAHAVAELNKEDGGNRQCILVTHGDENGKNIAEDITAERIKRVLSGKNWNDGVEREPLPGQLSYYRLKFAEVSDFPCCSGETLCDKLVGYVALEHGASPVRLESNFTVLSSLQKNVVVLSGCCNAVESEIARILTEAHAEGKENIVYLPSSQCGDSRDSIPAGWNVAELPVFHAESCHSLIQVMKSNRTLLPVAK